MSEPSHTMSVSCILMTLLDVVSESFRALMEVAYCLSQCTQLVLSTHRKTGHCALCQR